MNKLHHQNVIPSPRKSTLPFLKISLPLVLEEKPSIVYSKVVEEEDMYKTKSSENQFCQEWNPFSHIVEDVEELIFSKQILSTFSKFL
jgi:hypothetical protein